MESHLNRTPSEIDELRDTFVSRLELCHKIFGKMTFRLSEKKTAARLSQPLYDATMIAADRLYDRADDLIKNRTAIAKALAVALKDPTIYDLIVARPNTADAVRKRLDAVAHIFQSSLP
jgi:hypothetical protein